MADITIRHVEKFYGKTHVVHALDLDIRSQEFVVILGPSGCGKSTLLRMIAGLEMVSEGEIVIDGRVVNDLEPRERGCAMVFQNYALYPHMSVGENIGYALKVAGVPKAERQARVEEIARSVGLDEYLDRRPSQLSGGQRQRVAMARAMIREPKVFLFDEPLSNLDAILRVQMRVEIRKLHRRLGTTSVFVTHDQAEAMTLADRLVVMRAGRVEQVGTPAEVYNRPASKFVAGFIGSPPMNLIDGVIDELGAFVPATRETERLPLGRADLAGQKVTLGVRPESVSIVPSGAGIRVEVDFVEELGATRIIHAEWAGHTLMLVQSEGDVPQPGSTVAAVIAPGTVHLFSEADGHRIEAAPLDLVPA